MNRAQVTLRPLFPEGRQVLDQLAASRTAQARLVERAHILTANRRRATPQPGRPAPGRL